MKATKHYRNLNKNRGATPGLHFNIASEMAQGKYYYIKIVRPGENSPGTARSDTRHSHVHDFKSQEYSLFKYSTPMYHPQTKLLR